MPPCSRANATMSAASLSIAACSTVGLGSGVNSSSKRRTAVSRCSRILTMSRCDRIGVSTVICRPAEVTAGESGRSGLAPSATRSVIPSASRTLSSGGLVTWAKRCVKNFAMPPSRPDSTLIALPYPIADTRSDPLASIGSSRKRKLSVFSEYAT